MEGGYLDLDCGGGQGFGGRDVLLLLYVCGCFDEGGGR